MKKSVAMLNSFTNFLSGLGTARGKSAYSGFQRDFINPKDLIDLYSSSWLASKGVDIPIADMLRGFREMEGSPLPHDVKFSVITVLKEALTYLRVVGGSVIHFDTGMEDLSTPYRYNETLLRLIAIPCTSISPVGDETINRLNDVNYGMPEYFSINGDNENKIHISRLYIFPAKAPFRTYSGSNNAGFWKSGILEKAFKTIVRAGVVDSLIEDIVHQKNVDTFKIEGLMEMCST
ncbi:MAG: DUF1073 domain-containing protein, partial [Flavobacteriales bacterium]|nr:DUF1073 domain-containing protein [Flavobacteriales bacterium]